MKSVSISIVKLVLLESWIEALRFLFHLLLRLPLPPQTSFERPTQPLRPLLLRLVSSPPNPLPRIIDRRLPTLKDTDIIHCRSHKTSRYTCQPRAPEPPIAFPE